VYILNELVLMRHFYFIKLIRFKVSFLKGNSGHIGIIDFLGLCISIGFCGKILSRNDNWRVDGFIVEMHQ
jgi:hypothetical protein